MSSLARKNLLFVYYLDVHTYLTLGVPTLVQLSQSMLGSQRSNANLVVFSSKFVKRDKEIKKTVAIEHYEPIDLENINCITFMWLFTILIFFYVKLFDVLQLSHQLRLRIALDRSVRAGLELDRLKRRTLLEPYFYSIMKVYQRKCTAVFIWVSKFILVSKCRCTSRRNSTWCYLVYFERGRCIL